MPVYRFYQVNKINQVIAPGADRGFEDDLEALAHAEGLADGRAIDVWQGQRFVGHVGALNQRGGLTAKGA
jgi:hypothetical protein